MNYTYILKCADGTFYCGWTNCLEKRLKAHNDGTGAKYTRARRPVTLIYYEEFRTKEEAMKREAAVKRMTRRQKEQLIAGAGPGWDRHSEAEKNGSLHPAEGNRLRIMLQRHTS